MASGDTKTEHYLDVAANGSRADLPTDSCCETRSQTLIRGVAERVMNLEDEVHEWKDNPDIVDIVATYADLQNYDTSTLTDKDIIRVLQDEQHDGESTYYRWDETNNEFNYIGTVGSYYTEAEVDQLLSGKQNTLTAGSNIDITNDVISATDTTYSAFTGTDGQTAGTSGLVPAPAITDDGKYLKADGTWGAIATSSGAKVLTSADNNWNSTAHNSTTEPFDAIALWLLPNGIYIDDYNRYDSSLKIYMSDGNSAQSGNDSSIYLVTDSGTSSSPNRIVTQVNKDDIKQYRPAKQFNNVQMLTTFAKKNDIYYTNNSNTSDWARPQIGAQSNASGARAIAIGTSASATAKGSVAIGAYSSSSTVGVMNIGTSDTGHGYSTSNYRLLSGLYDGQSAHDAATVGQINATIDAINTALNVSIPHIGASS